MLDGNPKTTVFDSFFSQNEVCQNGFQPYSFVGFSEFEREIIRERTIAGLAAAREAGVRLGRKPKLTAAQKSHVRMLATTGQTNGQIAQVMGVSVSTIQRLTAAIDSSKSRILGMSS